MTSEPAPTPDTAGGETASRRPAVLVIAVVVVVAVALAAFLLLRRQAVRAIEYSESDGGRVLLVGADACKGEAEVRAEETGETVTLNATAERKWFGGQTICEIATVPVQLDEPLGDRTVLDAYSGEQVSESSKP